MKSFLILRCDSTSAINLTKNSILHSISKHIEIRYDFIRDHMIKVDCIIVHVNRNNQLSIIFTKHLPSDRL